MPASISPSHHLLVLLGPTASGKTRVGVELARHFQGEIISADSRQVFRGMDIGTGKDLQEYGEIRCHLLDILPAGAEFSLFQFQQAFYAAWRQIRDGGRLPLLVGGTGLYIDSILRRYELQEVPENPELRGRMAELPLEELQAELIRLRPELHNSTDLLERERLLRALEIAHAGATNHTSPPRPELNPLVFGLRWERPELQRRIALRLRQRLEEGMVAEVEALVAGGLSWENLEYYGLEYRFIGRYLRREINLNDMRQQLQAAINKFAKRQESFFRRMERKGVVIDWVDGGAAATESILARLRDLGVEQRGGLLVSDR